MGLPQFLIIGAMKSGTTSLFFDLMANPAIFFPDDKEPSTLATDDVLSAAGRAAYHDLFRSARPGQLCGEASTDYSKLPDIPGVPERAARVLGTAVKIIYLVREPVARTISQHYHELAGGTVDANVDEAVRTCPRLIHYSLYGRQILPWIETFGEQHVYVVRFERYVANRRGVVAELSEFLGVPPALEQIEPGHAYNSSERMWARGGPLWRFARGSLYRTWLRPFLSRKQRSRLRDLLLPKAPDRPDLPSLDTVDYILDRVRPDLGLLQTLTAWNDPPWDLDLVRRRHATVSAGPPPRSAYQSGRVDAQ